MTPLPAEREVLIRCEGQEDAKMDSEDVTRENISAVFGLGSSGWVLLSSDNRMVKLVNGVYSVQAEHLQPLIVKVNVDTNAVEGTRINAPSNIPMNATLARSAPYGVGMLVPTASIYATNHKAAKDVPRVPLRRMASNNSTRGPSPAKRVKTQVAMEEVGFDGEAQTIDLTGGASLLPKVKIVPPLILKFIVADREKSNRPHSKKVPDVMAMVAVPRDKLTFAGVMETIAEQFVKYKDRVISDKCGAPLVGPALNNASFWTSNKANLYLLEPLNEKSFYARLFDTINSAARCPCCHELKERIVLCKNLGHISSCNDCLVEMARAAESNRKRVIKCTSCSRESAFDLDQHVYTGFLIAPNPVASVKEWLEIYLIEHDMALPANIEKAHEMDESRRNSFD